MLATAPAVVQPRQKIESTSAGKLALAAIAKASDTMKATFWPLNVMPSATATTPRPTVAMRATRELLAGVGVAAAHDVHPEIVRERRRARQREAGDHGEDRREGDRGDEAEERRAAEQLGEQRRRHVAARVDGADRVGPDQHHRAEAEDEGHQVEDADQAGRVEHRRARRARVGHGVEAHQDVRQAGGAEHQRHAERDARRAGSTTSLPGREHAVAVALGRGGEERARVACRSARARAAPSSAAPPSSSTAFTICTQVVAIMPPNST